MTVAELSEKTPIELELPKAFKAITGPAAAWLVLLFKTPPQKSGGLAGLSVVSTLPVASSRLAISAFGMEMPSIGQLAAGAAPLVSVPVFELASNAAAAFRRPKE